MGNLNVERLSRWICAADELCRELLDATIAALDHQDAPRDMAHFVLRQLVVTCHLTSESAILLLLHNRLWDVEMLMRSVLEGTMKLAFISTSDKTLRESRADEYWNILPDMDRLRDHERLVALLADVDNPDDDEWRPFRDMLLDASMIDELRQKYPRSMRRKLQHQWTFNELAKKVSPPNSSNSKFNNFRAFAHAYAIGSHLLHQDGVATGVILDHSSRSSLRRTSKEFVHASRVTQDLVVFSYFRAQFIYRMLQISVKPINGIHARWEECAKEISAAGMEWRAIEYGDVNDPD